MKINKIREMSSPDLEKELGELKSELFKLRFSLATNGLDNPMKIKEVKKDIAKIKTVLTQRELNGGKDVEVKNVVKEAKKAPAKKETASEEPKKEAKKTTAKKETAKKTTKKAEEKESKLFSLK